MIELSSPISSITQLLTKMKQDWKFQKQNNKQESNYPINKKPSEVYVLLYGSMPFSSNTRHILKLADKNWILEKNHYKAKYNIKAKTNKGEFNFDIYATAANVISIVAAKIAKITQENISLVRYKINNRIYEVDINLVR